MRIEVTRRALPCIKMVCHPESVIHLLLTVFVFLNRNDGAQNWAKLQRSWARKVGQQSSLHT